MEGAKASIEKAFIEATNAKDEAIAWAIPIEAKLGVNYLGPFGEESGPGQYWTSLTKAKKWQKDESRRLAAGKEEAKTKIKKGHR